MALITFLQGKKSYILGTLAFVVLVLNLMGILDASATTQMLTVLGFGSIFTLRAAIAKM